MTRTDTSRTSLLAITVALLAPSMLAAQPATSPPPDPLVKANATVKVGPHTYLIPDGNVPLVPNVGIVVGSRATLVIDPGLGRQNGETVAREIAKVSKNSELFVTATHFHAEHTTGYIGLPATAKFISPTIQESEFAQDGAPQIQLFSKRSPMTAELLKDAVAPKVAVRFDRDYMLDLGGVSVRMLVVGPTHTRGDTAMFVEGDNVLFAGDVVMNNSFLAATQSTSMKAWLAAFDTFQSWRPTVIVPSHGAMGDGSLVARNRTVMTTIQSRARELKAQGRSADEAAATIQKELQSAHPDWPRANGIAAAARSAYAEATPP
jgi:glyoxylase-like metal-dependent hydrolase (beta-lactamase superfamily II)